MTQYQPITYPCCWPTQEYKRSYAPADFRAPYYLVYTADITDTILFPILLDKIEELSLVMDETFAYQAQLDNLREGRAAITCYIEECSRNRILASEPCYKQVREKLHLDEEYLQLDNPIIAIYDIGGKQWDQLNSTWIDNELSFGKINTIQQTRDFLTKPLDLYGELSLGYGVLPFTELLLQRWSEYN